MIAPFFAAAECVLPAIVAQIAADTFAAVPAESAAAAGNAATAARVCVARALFAAAEADVGVTHILFAAAETAVCVTHALFAAAEACAVACVLPAAILRAGLVLPAAAAAPAVLFASVHPAAITIAAEQNRIK